MANLSSAQVQSVEALAEFKAALVQFRAEVQDAVASLHLDVRRAEEWLQERRKSWERAVRECYDEVVRAKAELTRRQMVPPGDRVPDTSQQEEDLRKAQARLRYAEDRVERCRRWVGLLAQAIEEFEGPVRRMGTRAELDLPKAAGSLERSIQRVEEYIASASPTPPRVP